MIVIIVIIVMIVLIVVIVVIVALVIVDPRRRARAPSDPQSCRLPETRQHTLR